MDGRVIFVTDNVIAFLLYSRPASPFLNYLRVDSPITPDDSFLVFVTPNGVKTSGNMPVPETGACLGPRSAVGVASPVPAK